MYHFYNCVRRPIVRFIYLIVSIAIPCLLSAQQVQTLPVLPGWYTLTLPATMPEDKDLLHRLVDNPQDLLSRVTLIKKSDKEICTTTQDIHVVYPIELKKFRNTLVDYARYPEFFSKVKKSEFVVEGSLTRQTQTTVVSILGFEVKSVFTIALLEHNGDRPNSDIIQWYQIDGDHSVEAIQGYWYLEEFVQDNKTMTYVRYSTATEVPKTMVGQDWFMGLFLSSFARDNLIAVRQAATK